MQLLRVFSIIIALVLIIASSSNISFKSGNDVNPGINTKGPLIDSILLSIDDKSTFSSLLQTISAQEQEQHEVDQEENEKDSDSIMEREEEQDRGDSERESSIGQEKEQQDSEKEQKQDEIKKEDCGPTEHFDSEVDSCIPDHEKVCNDDRDNDDSRVDSEDSDCLSNKNDQEQQDNKHQEKEKLLAGEEEPSLDNKENNNGGKNPVPIEEQNNSTSSDSHNTEDKAQNSSQNLTNSNSTATTSNNNTSLDELHQYANASAAEEDSFTLNCHPAEAEMVPGAEGSIPCTIENKTPKPIELVLGCSGLDDTGIECYINGEYPTGTTLVKEMSHTNFSVLVVSSSSPPVPAGSYPFTISAEKCVNPDLC